MTPINEEPTAEPTAETTDETTEESAEESTDKKSVFSQTLRALLLTTDKPLDARVEFLRNFWNFLLFSVPVSWVMGFAAAMAADRVDFTESNVWLYGSVRVLAIPLLIGLVLEGLRVRNIKGLYAFSCWSVVTIVFFTSFILYILVGEA